ncbi:helix-turn-helix domain-containing protein [Cedecea sp. NFIX57]|uniref:helix-turn-helix domain-containing protein n=1 Tax=Cedecea sp. NFIX57 TaxID=1566286 RepID=UPI000A1CA552|nr:helix-turn-helix transcriptional regulator [Cedecea sp. NFIX57]
MFIDTEKKWHRKDILAAVQKKKKSLSALSRDNGLSSGTLGNALYRPWAKGEKIIADFICVSPEEIWPERYFKTNGVRKKRKAINS